MDHRQVADRSRGGEGGRGFDRHARAVPVGEQEFEVDGLYEDIVRIAAQVHRSERASHTLQPTAVANEAYLRLSQQRNAWQGGRAYFLTAAAAVVRRVLVDYARGRQAAKRGGGWGRVDLATVDIAFVPDVSVIDLDDALDTLAELSSRQARIVELRFFGGMEVHEVAATIGVSPRTVASEWRVARAWLRTRLASGRSR